MTSDEQTIQRLARRRFAQYVPDDPRGILAKVPIHFATTGATADLAKAAQSVTGAYAEKRRKVQEDLAAAEATLAEHQRKLAEIETRAQATGEQARLTDTAKAEEERRTNLQMGDVRSLAGGYAARKAGEPDFTFTPVTPAPRRSIVEYRGTGAGGDGVDDLTAREQDIVGGKYLNADYQAAKRARYPKAGFVFSQQDPRVARGLSPLEQSASHAADQAVALAMDPTRLAEARVVLNRARQSLIPTGDAMSVGDRKSLTFTELVNVQGILADAESAISAQESRLKAVSRSKMQQHYGVTELMEEQRGAGQGQLSNEQWLNTLTPEEREALGY